MMCSTRDDPMDLGPFLQEYVLRNPFENLPNGVPPGLSSGGKQKGSKSTGKKVSPRGVQPPVKKARCVLVTSPLSHRDSSPSAPPSLSGSPPPPVLVSPPGLGSPSSRSPPSLSPFGTSNVVCVKQEIEDGTLTLVPVESGVGQPAPLPEDEGEISPDETDPETENRSDSEALESKGSDPLKAHIGSNLSYAVALRELRLPPKHVKVKKWLTGHYKHVTSHSGWLASDTLLTHARASFPEMKSSVLSRIMKFTFPECRKVINKYGYFYAGLLPKPSAGDVENLQLQRACGLVDAGRMTVSRAAEQYGGTVNQIGAMVAWNKLTPLSEEQIEQVEKVVEEKRGASGTVSSRLRFQLRLNAQARGTRDVTSLGEQQEASSGTTVRKNRRKRGLPPKFRDCYLDYQPDSESANELSSNEAENTDLAEQRHVIGSTMKQEPTNEENLSHMTNGQEEQNNERNEMLSGETVLVKEEPLDLAFEKPRCDAVWSENARSSESNQDHPVHSPSTPSRRTRSRRKIAPAKAAASPTSEATNLSVKSNEGSTTGNDTSSKNSGRNGTSPFGKAASPRGGNSNSGTNSTGTGTGSAIHSVVDLLSMRRELHVTCAELQDARAQNADLETRLTHAHDEIATLREVLRTRDTQITNLSNSFSDLSERFMSTAGEFKRVMQTLRQDE